jgi:nucleoid DNA-binding protein
MVDISMYIAEILEDNGRVTIPGIGTFYKKKMAAYFDEQRQIFFPPAQNLSFEEKHDEDTYLAEYISKTENISAAEVNDILKDYTSKLNDKIESSGLAEIPGLGILKKEGAHFNVESVSSYGLQPLQEIKSSTSYVDTSGEIISEEINKEPPYLNGIEKTAEKFDYISPEGIEQVSQNDETVSENTEVTERTSGKIWLIVTVFLLILIGAPVYFFYPQIKRFVQNEQVASPVKKQPARKLEPVPQNPEDSIAYVQLEQKIAPVKSPDTIAKTQPAPVISGPVDYEIIVAAWGAKNDAESHIKQLSRKGIDAHIVEKLSGKYKYEISLGTYKDISSAQAAKQKAIKNFSDVWIDQIKPKTN